MSEEANNVPVVSTTKQSKIVFYKVEEDCVNLRRSGLSYQGIAEELNASGKIPADDPVDKWVVMRFLDKIPAIQKKLVSESKQRMIEVVNTNFDIIFEINSMFSKTKQLLEMMEDDAFEKGRFVNPYQYKAVVSEMREMLKQMTDIQKEINDYNNIRQFMDIVITTIQEEVPEKLPIIVEKLKVVKGTKWFADMIAKETEKK